MSHNKNLNNLTTRILRFLFVGDYRDIEKRGLGNRKFIFFGLENHQAY